jgi:hypothetical protein
MMMGDPNSSGKFNGPPTLESHPRVSYLDDLTITSDSPETLVDRVWHTLSIAREQSAIFKPSKCHFGGTIGQQLGYVIRNGKYSPLLKHTEGVMNLPFLKSKLEMKHLLGIANFIRDFTPNFASIAATLHDCVKTGFDLSVISPHLLKALDDLKDALANRQELCAINYDLPIVLRTDASEIAFGFEPVNIAPDDSDIPILFGSHKLTEVARNWSTIEQEGFAIYLATADAFRDLLIGHEFVVETDHRNLQFINRTTKRKVQNWSSQLRDFQFTLRHILGESNVVADALSRLCAYTPLARPRAVLLSMTTRGRKKALKIIAATDANDDTEDEFADSIEEAEDSDDYILLPNDVLNSTTIDPTTALPIPPVDTTPVVLTPDISTEETTPMVDDNVEGDPLETETTPIVEEGIPDLFFDMCQPASRVPIEFQALIRQVHNAENGHLGILKALRALRANGIRFFNMARMVTLYIRECAVCQKTLRLC